MAREGEQRRHLPPHFFCDDYSLALKAKWARCMGFKGLIYWDAADDQDAIGSKVSWRGWQSGGWREGFTVSSEVNRNRIALPGLSLIDMLFLSVNADTCFWGVCAYHMNPVFSSGWLSYASFTVQQSECATIVAHSTSFAGTKGQMVCFGNANDDCGSAPVGPEPEPEPSLPGDGGAIDKGSCPNYQNCIEGCLSTLT